MFEVFIESKRIFWRNALYCSKAWCRFSFVDGCPPSCKEFRQCFSRNQWLCEFLPCISHFAKKIQTMRPFAKILLAFVRTVTSRKGIRSSDGLPLADLRTVVDETQGGRIPKSLDCSIIGFKQWGDYSVTAFCYKARAGTASAPLNVIMMFSWYGSHDGGAVTIEDCRCMVFTYKIVTSWVCPIILAP